MLVKCRRCVNAVRVYTGGAETYRCGMTEDGNYKNGLLRLECDYFETAEDQNKRISAALAAQEGKSDA